MKAELLRKLDKDVFDYQTLMHALSGYASPRDRVTAMLRNGDIIRIKKGLYVLADVFRRKPLELGLLANLVYGPSMVSLDYALAYYGMIPERVDVITSVATGRSRRFTSPVGTFVYRPTACLSPGMLIQDRSGQLFLMACRERALADKLCDDRKGGQLRSHQDMREYLCDNLRIYPDDLATLDVELLEQVAEAVGSLKVSLCAAVIRRMKGGEG
ncbi:MAG: hypothetical protein EOL87_18565 [Spartobacteria bacterium]|nr:hypothetical protein [Spartobacteria bacterium]